ncbi:MAG: hypothetical protein LBD12_00915 [Clostridiales Family XIII bacterium]|jgi:hypothetical protein|nr:hypothetical protein [Clostridiales Family XIII bacterium]
MGKTQEKLTLMLRNGAVIPTDAALERLVEMLDGSDVGLSLQCMIDRLYEFEYSEDLWAD